MSQQQHSSAGVPRRSFLVALGTTIVGAFRMPTFGRPSTRDLEDVELPDELLRNTKVIDGVLKNRIRRLLCTPVRSDDGTGLAWLETWDDDHPDEDPHVMAWTLETDEELSEGRRFFECAHWRSWRTLGELEAMVTGEAYWLLRWNYLETYQLVATRDPAKLRDESAETFTSDPKLAARFTPREVLDVLPGLMEIYGSWERGSCYLEPVREEVALEPNPGRWRS